MMSNLQARDTLKFDKYQDHKKSHFFNSYFMKKLLNRKDKKYQIKDDKYTYLNVLRWTNKFNPFEYKCLYFPIHSPGHWTLAVIYIDDLVISYYDSMGGSGTYYLEHLLHWLEDEFIKQKIGKDGDTLNRNLWTLNNGSNIKSPQQYRLRIAIPEHINFDCGLFVIQCADFISDNLPLMTKDKKPKPTPQFYSQESMRRYRFKVGADIVRGELNYPI